MNEEYAAHILKDGGAKTAKSTGAEAIREGLAAQGFRVATADAGENLRRLTEEVAHLLGSFDAILEHPNETDEAISEVIETDTVFKNRTSVEDLQRPDIARTVAAVSLRKSVQLYNKAWFEGVASRHTRGSTDVVIISGRNPRDRLSDWYQANGHAPVLDLVLRCDAEVAAKRVLVSRGIVLDESREVGAKTPELVAATTDIVNRRTEDEKREIYPYIEPFTPLECAAGSMSDTDIARMVARSYDLAAPDCTPLPIIYDTTHVELQAMKLEMVLLARTACDAVYSLD